MEITQREATWTPEDQAKLEIAQGFGEKIAAILRDTFLTNAGHSVRFIEFEAAIKTRDCYPSSSFSEADASLKLRFVRADGKKLALEFGICLDTCTYAEVIKYTAYEACWFVEHAKEPSLDHD